MPFHHPAARLSISLALPLVPAAVAFGVPQVADSTDPAPTTAEAPSLAEYFGFDGLDILPVGAACGPSVVADFDGDNLLDLIVANNRLSRLELFRQRPGASPDDPVAPPIRVNEFPDHWRFDRSWVPLGHEVTSLSAGDFDGDGVLEIAYAGQPGTIAFLEQTEPGKFEVVRRETVRGLVPSREGFVVADLAGDGGLEAVGIVAGRVQVWPILDGYRLGEATVLSSGSGAVSSILVEDVDGDGNRDLIGVIPEDPAPIRIWLATSGGEEGGRSFGPQLRFEMPALRRAEVIRLPNEKAARLAVIERASKRVATFELLPDQTDEGAGRESLRFFGFDDPTARKRLAAVGDLDGDGLLDLAASNIDANSVVVYRQVPGRGFERAKSFPCYADLEGLAVGNLDADGRAELLLQSEKEGVAGVADFEGGSLSFPRALAVTAGHVPLTVATVPTAAGDLAAVVVRKDKSWVLELIGAERTSVPLGDLTRAPAAILSLDADGTGRPDLLLLTPDRPMIMLQSQEAPEGASPWRLRTSQDMGQFGLVQAASADNTAVIDLDGDGRQELLVADRNFVRGLRFDDAPKDGSTAGWQVVGQLNADRADSKLVSLAVLRDRVIAADRENNRLVVFGRGTEGAWSQVESIELEGFRVRSIRAGSFSGSAGDDVLVIADDGFAVVRLDGGGPVLAEVGSWRPEDPRALHHDLGGGDLNGDGFTDLVAADAGRQSIDLLTFAEDGSMLFATGFPIFETKIFSAGEVREFEPHQMLVEDVTGDGLDDLILLCHDRVLVYPQGAVGDASP